MDKMHHGVFTNLVLRWERGKFVLAVESSVHGWGREEASLAFSMPPEAIENPSGLSYLIGGHLEEEGMQRCKQFCRPSGRSVACVVERNLDIKQRSKRSGRGWPARDDELWQLFVLLIVANIHAK